MKMRMCRRQIFKSMMIIVFTTIQEAAVSSYPVVTRQEFLELCKMCFVSEKELPEALRYLAFLGTTLCFTQPKVLAMGPLLFLLCIFDNRTSFPFPLTSFFSYHALVSSCPT